MVLVTYTSRTSQPSWFGMTTTTGARPLFPLNISSGASPHAIIDVQLRTFQLCDRKRHRRRRCRRPLQHLIVSRLFITLTSYLTSTKEDEQTTRGKGPYAVK